MFGLPPLPRTLGAALADAGHARVHVRLSALRDLVRLTRGTGEREAVLRGLEGLLADPKPELRAEAALGLADAEAVGSCEPLLSLLSDADARVRQMAVLALGELGEPNDRVLAARVGALLAAPEPPVRFQALIAFARLSPTEAEPALGSAADDDDEEVRAMAFRLMDSHYQDGTLPPPLVARAHQALGDAESAVRATAALLLARREERAAFGAIAGVIDGSVPAATEADVLAAFEIAVAHKLAEVRPGLRRRAFGPLGVRSDSLAWHALVSLAALGDERARHVILRGLSAWTRDARTLAVVGAGRAGLTEARARIDAFRGDPRRADPEVVDEALRALGSIAG